MNRQTRIKLVDASLGYTTQSGDTQVLEKLNLEFFSGDLVAIVGINGSGKSTLLKSMCGLLPFLEGQIELDHEHIETIALQDIAKKIAIVLTERLGGFNLTVFDAVAAGQIPYTDAFHRLREENLITIEAAIQKLGLMDYRNKALNELSDGLFQKTMIAKALAQQTPSILLDEPGAFLDYASKHELFLLLKKLTETENKCVLVSSHDLDLVLKYCPKLLVVANQSATLINTIEAKNNSEFLRIGGGFI